MFPNEDWPLPEYPEKAFEAAVAEQFPGNLAQQDQARVLFYDDYTGEHPRWDLTEEERKLARRFAFDQLSVRGFDPSFINIDAE